VSTEGHDDHPTSDAKRELRDRSAQILGAIDDLHQMETEKRRQPISTPQFHHLAEDITRKSRDVFRIAIDQEEIGDKAQRGEQSIEEIDRLTRPDRS
jgi:hypothetical protein